LLKGLCFECVVGLFGYIGLGCLLRYWA